MTILVVLLIIALQNFDDDISNFNNDRFSESGFGFKFTKNYEHNDAILEI